MTVKGVKPGSKRAVILQMLERGTTFERIADRIESDTGHPYGVRLAKEACRLLEYCYGYRYQRWGQWIMLHPSTPPKYLKQRPKGGYWGT